MIEFNYLYRGLCGLANAHRASALAGHLGAAVVAGYFFGEDQAELDEQVDRGVERELDRVMRGEEGIWFNSKKAGITSQQLFEALPQEQPVPESVSTIADALAANIGRTRESGHNVIFAAIALRALHDHPEYATPTIVSGVRKLIEGFNASPPGRGYFGKEKGWLQGYQVTFPVERFPPYKSEQEMANVVIDELIATASVRKQGFGGLWHIINHTAALIELSRFGYRELAAQGWPAHRDHVRMWRSLPDVEAELGPPTKSDLDPRTREYWTTGTLKRDEARLTHRIKTLYGYFVLERSIEDEPRRTAAADAFLYLMA